MHILSEALHEHSTGHGEAAPWEYYLPKRHTLQRKAGRTWGRVAALCDQWETDTVGPLCTAPVHSMCLVANLTSISRPLRWRRRYCQAIFRSRHIGLSHRLRRHHASHPAGNAPESPVGTRVQGYRSFAESPVGTDPRSYRRQKRPFTKAMPGECPA